MKKRSIALLLVLALVLSLCAVTAAAGEKAEETTGAENGETGEEKPAEEAPSLAGPDAQPETDLETGEVIAALAIEPDAVGTVSFANVTFHTDAAEDTIVVPTEAILTSNGAQYVYVVEEGTAKYVAVTTGLIGSGVTEITSGLAEGARLMVVGQAYLADGDPVRVVGEEG